MRISDWSSDVCSSDLDSGLPQNPSDYSEIAGDALIVTEVTADRARAEEQLANQQIEVVVVAPGDAEERFRNGEQRSEERRGGKECCSTCRSRWSRHL